ncbi:hypothetical protein E2C01_076009 [Portunus trituberculatus]|uniref:Uncharacterized protein n=1 Tax=Portunus trituberculatus TaxID=210409 RepID=A0A5B7IGQ9_PORTR|nr:hypothetical protein [Portunus trituberculatus]
MHRQQQKNNFTLSTSYSSLTASTPSPTLPMCTSGLHQHQYPINVATIHRFPVTHCHAQPHRHITCCISISSHISDSHARYPKASSVDQ